MLHRYAIATATATFLLLIAGALVTSTGSGLAVPDWPRSYGRWFPPMAGGVLYEHGHRMVAAVVALMILALAVWLWSVEPRRWTRRLGYCALGTVLIQALLGGATVLLHLPAPVSIAHACLGQALFCLVVCLTACTSPAWTDRPPPVDDRRVVPTRVLAVVVAGLSGVQLVLGAVIRHTGDAVFVHLGTAGLLGVAAVRLAAQATRFRRERPALWRAALCLVGLISVQLVVGGFVFLHRGIVALRTAHVAIGALVLAQAITLAWELIRRGGPLSTRRAQDYLELTKPRLTMLVLFTTAAGFWLGLAAPAGLARLWPALVGTALCAGGANALNQWMERREDALMRRTHHRPLPAGRLTPETTWRFGTALAVAGLALLAAAVNPLASGLAAVCLVSYLGLYTPMKRTTPLCTLVGAIPGAIPPMIGWAAAREHLDPGAWALFGMLFIWQLPHFLAIAVLYREDYARAGFKMLPLTESSGVMAARQMALSGLVLVPVSLVPAVMGVAGEGSFYGALALSLGFLTVCGYAAVKRSAVACRHLFHASLLYLPVWLGLLAWDKRWGWPG